MVSKELKKLGRRELVDIIYQMKKNEQLQQEEIAALQEEVAALQKALQDKRIHLSAAGSIAEAALSVTNVFSTAQAAADLYLQEIARMQLEAEVECARLIDEAKQKAAEIISQNEAQRAILNEQYQREYVKWYKLHRKLQALEKASQPPSRED